MALSGLTEQSTKIVHTICTNENLNFIKVNVSNKPIIGDGYASQFLNLIVHGYDRNGDDKSLHLIMKTASSHKNARENFDVDVLFSREIYFYEVVYKEFHKFQIERKIMSPLQTFPKYFYGSVEPMFEVVVLENLKESGFEMWDFRKHLTYDIAKFAMHELGKFHAISFALRNQKPELFADMARNMKDTLMPLMKICKFMSVDFLKQCCEKAKDALDPVNDRVALDRYETYLKTFVRNCDKLLNPKDLVDYSVIGHGSFWINNLMFKFKKTENLVIPQEMRMVDFQLSRMSSPVLDISYFFFPCGARIYAYIDDLLQAYHNSLSLFLYQLGSNAETIYPLEIFKKHWKQYAAYGMIWTMVTGKILTMEGEDVGRELSDSLLDVPPNDAYLYTVRRAILYCVDNDII